MNRILILIALLINSVYFVGATGKYYRTLTTDDSNLCSWWMGSKMSLRESQPGLLVSLGEQRLSWLYENHCHFIVEVEEQDWRDFGVYAVVQNLNFRYDAVNKDCIDYIEFKTLGSDWTKKICGTGRISEQPITTSDNSNFSFVAPKGKMEVTIHIDKESSAPKNGKTDMSIAFTLFEDRHLCRSSYTTCGKRNECILSDLIGDGIVNCPYLYSYEESTLDPPVIIASPRTTERSIEDILGIPLTYSHSGSQTITDNTQVPIAVAVVAALVILLFVTCVLICRKCRRRSSQQSPVADVNSRAPLIASIVMSEQSAPPYILQQPQGIATAVPHN